MRPFRGILLAAGLLTPLVHAAGCGSDNLSTGTTPSPTAPQQTSVSGQVYEITPAGRTAAPAVEVRAVVVTVSGCSSPCQVTKNWSYHSTTSAPDGRYSFADLPRGDVTILASAPGFQQVCGAGVRPDGSATLDVEITSRTHPQRSPTNPPLRVSGQIYEMTPRGRVGVSGAWLGVDHHGPDSPFLTVHADADGRYTLCGIPAGWDVAFDAGQVGYDGQYVWRTFAGDATLDLELKRRE